MLSFGETELQYAERSMHSLILRYYAETNAQDGIPPLEMQWDFFRKLEDSGCLFILAARDGDTLVGFAMYILTGHPQHGMMPSAICNTLAVDTKWRGQGIGTELVERALPILKEKDVKLVTHGHRMIYKAEPLFPKLGFTLEEQIYIKVL